MFTTSVQNHQQLSSGNKKLRNSSILVALTLALGVSSCTPKVGVLRSPDYKGNVGSNTGTESGESSNSTSKDKETAGSKKDNVAKKFIGRNISLVLPFQLDLISESTLTDKDIKRSALALDYYQGFQLGLEELAKSGANFNLNVLDSRDNANHSSTLALSSEIQGSSLIIGPVYPQEIKAFGSNLEDKETLQINPLAASMPTEFNLPNLVSLTPPIKAHSNAIAARVAREHSAGDVIIIYNTTDSDGKQFLNGMSTAIKQAKGSVNVISVSSVSQLNDNLSLTGTNLIVTGTTDKLQLKTLLNNLTKKYTENAYAFHLFGHPLWDRYDFNMYSNFSDLNPTITSESNLKPWSNAVKAFKDKYYSLYGVNPSDQSYKGYDSALYFGGMINKYGVDRLKEKLTIEPYNGLFSSYKFRHNETWGYANESVSFRSYRSGSFQLQ
ncbi:ABC-type branched-chain amino acid transport system, substrate-binding protein [Sphingobacterium nematocida]|uniref:ABC-type branched-chain amino acid transport system, substrate-binding protein n=1 Tax=Sphingobacterium nematocida TaxID=1513896 RepID=A0A1T5E090_9SPHI|nr:ABC-type branched-chain amino acid transport system, substrate-binding protein [Sphingobacterium nematocida]